MEHRSLLQKSRDEGTGKSKNAGRVLPFLKWAGGKRWLVDSYPNYIPTKFKTYIEPFLGSAALFFYLAPKRSILADINPDLVNCYTMLREDWASVEVELERHEILHCEEHYYRTRSKIPRGLSGRAARFLYLNRTCWNGLYRENRRGEFNVPMGTKDSVFLEDDNFAVCSALLQGADIVCSDFEEIIDRAESGDLVFADPPYTVKHNLNGFLKYNQKIFSWDDQIRLREALVRARARGALVLATNAAHESVAELYADFEQTRLTRRSAIGGTPASRTRTEELLIRAW